MFSKFWILDVNTVKIWAQWFLFGLKIDQTYYDQKKGEITMIKMVYNIIIENHHMLRL